MSEQMEPVRKSKVSDSVQIANAIANVDVDSLSSPVLKRLIEEVRNESDPTVGIHDAYDRVHNRHNR